MSVANSPRRPLAWNNKNAGIPGCRRFVLGLIHLLHLCVTATTLVWFSGAQLSGTAKGNLTFFLSRHADHPPWFSSSRLGTNARRLPPAELHSQRGGSLGCICVSRQEPGNEADFFFRDAANHRTAERRKLGQRDPFNRPPSILLRLLRGHLWRRSLVLWSQPTASR